jgi:hypothetical protein
MKITKQRLKEIIKEELEAVVDEGMYSITDPPSKFGGSHRDTTGLGGSTSSRPSQTPADKPPFKVNDRVEQNRRGKGVIQRVKEYPLPRGWIATVKWDNPPTGIDNPSAVQMSILSAAE